MKLILGTVLAIGLLVVSCLVAQDKKEIDKLNGKWVVVSAERDGKAWDAMKGAVRVNTGDKYVLTPMEGKAIQGAMKIDVSKKPKTMDMSPTEGNFKDKTLLGIYEVDGDTLPAVV
jgi:uncharacterized protein (TIGR03067 family)